MQKTRFLEILTNVQQNELQENKIVENQLQISPSLTSIAYYLDRQEIPGFI